MNEGCKFWDGDTNYEFHNPDNFSTQHYKASGITITQKAYAGIWPSKMKNNGLHFPILRIRIKIWRIVSYIFHSLEA